MNNAVNFRRACGRLPTLGLLLCLSTAPLLCGGTAKAQSAAADQNPARRSAARSLEVPRLHLFIQQQRDITFTDAARSVTVVDAGVLRATLLSVSALHLEAIAEGETLVIVTTEHERRMMVVEVTGHPVTEVPDSVKERIARRAKPSRGFMTLGFSPGFGGTRAALTNQFSYQVSLSPDRQLIVHGDLNSFLGHGRSAVDAANLGFNQLTADLLTRSGTFTFLDSTIDISSTNLFGYALRGVRFVGAEHTRFDGWEAFGGAARPSLGLWGASRGLAFGVLAPLLRRENIWRVRAGVIWAQPAFASLAPDSDAGPILHTDARYLPDERTNVSGSLDVARSGVSWETRLNLRRRSFTFLGEASHLNSRSPFIGIGAQAAGRTAAAVSLSWQPTVRFNASAGYNTFRSFSAQGSRSPANALPESMSFFAGASWQITGSAQFGGRLSEQRATICARGFGQCYQTESRNVEGSFSLSHGSWSNRLEGRASLNLARRAGARLNQGRQLRDELRRQFGSNLSATAFFDDTKSADTLAALALQDPSLLPAALAQAFTADPDRFLFLNRDTLSQYVLAGSGIPETSGQNAGVRAQWTSRRAALTGELRRSHTDFASHSERYFLASASAHLKLDATDTVGLSVVRAFGASTGLGATHLSLSLTHRFGESEGGFSFGKLLGLDRSRVAGRVFIDTNGNGLDDAGEVGAGGIQIILDGKRETTTDASGQYSFAINGGGAHSIALAPATLGENLRATTASERPVELRGRKSLLVNFGVTTQGFIAGRVFNDPYLNGSGARDLKANGFGGVRFVLRRQNAQASASAPLEVVTDGGGDWEFRNLLPGDYLLELDGATVPPDFNLPAQISWPVKVNPLRGTFVDVPLVAQRAITGIVFIDRNGNNQYDEGIDEAIEGARIDTSRSRAVSGRGGVYILRGLPAGRIELRVTTPAGRPGPTTLVELETGPVIRRAVNVAIVP